MIILHFQVKIKASVEIPVIKPHCENQIIAVILVDKGNILAQSKLRDQRLPASSPYLKTWMDSCCAHVSVIVYRTAIRESKQLIIVWTLLSLSSSPASWFSFIFCSYPTVHPASPSELWLVLKIPTPWQCSETHPSASYLIHLSRLSSSSLPVPFLSPWAMSY